MLELIDIKKDYAAGNTVVHALKGISLKFRKSEFVSILGQSGCGKTTMLNIIGGLDQYTEGDLVVNGVSTKKYKDRDWDRYRNHSIGFVFQSYNLIPHQTVLQNVELALTLSGVSKKERRERAAKALEQVGLGDQLKKRPSEMSGGQMQRVAIARALVNNPDIILADEPTGALDSETSVQVMEILKEISKDRLIIMVTHNPELAEQYSSRIIRMLDGEVKSDSMPLTSEEEAEEAACDREKQAGMSQKNPTMSFATSFGLSLKNLFTKKGRTLLTAFAGSIGIIGIALILAISQGTTNYINAVQEETLSSYPLSIQETTTDLGSIMEMFMGTNAAGREHDTSAPAVYEKSSVYEMIDAYSNLDYYDNDLKSFKTYLEEEYAKEDSSLHQALNGVHYTYNLPLAIYTKNVDGNIKGTDTQDLLTQIIMNAMGVDMSSMISLRDTMMSSYSSSSASVMNSNMNIWQEMLPGLEGETINPLIESQYDLLAGSWPEEYNEILLVIDENNELDDMSLYALGLVEEEYITETSRAAINGEAINFRDKSWSFDELMELEYHLVLPSDCYAYNAESGKYEDLRGTDTGLQYLYDNGTVLKVVGIVRPNPDATSTMLSGCLAYTSKLTEYVITAGEKSQAIAAQKADPEMDIFTGLQFSNTVGELTDLEKRERVEAWFASLSEEEKAEQYLALMSEPSEEVMAQYMTQYQAMYSEEELLAMMTQSMTAEMGVSEEQVSSYLAGMSAEEKTELVNEMLAEQIRRQYAQQVAEQFAQVPTAQLAALMEQEVASYTDEQFVLLFDDVIEFSSATYEDNLLALGALELDSPSAIHLYASTFENKDVIEDAISTYNDGREELERIKYTDYIGIMMSSITTIIHAITYVLIAFVAISLIVSSIMIGVITLISVQERTKEIGILRAIGASKRDVSGLFNAETIIIGFASGLLGVAVTWLLCLPINLVIHRLTEIESLNAVLPLPAAIILVIISMVLTLISGVIPSRSAAKKDPVVALRTE